MLSLANFCLIANLPLGGAIGQTSLQILRQRWRGDERTSPRPLRAAIANRANRLVLHDRDRDRRNEFLF